MNETLRDQPAYDDRMEREDAIEMCARNLQPLVFQLFQYGDLVIRNNIAARMLLHEDCSIVVKDHCELLRKDTQRGELVWMAGYLERLGYYDGDNEPKDSDIYELFDNGDLLVRNRVFETIQHYSDDRDCIEYQCFNLVADALRPLGDTMMKQHLELMLELDL